MGSYRTITMGYYFDIPPITSTKKSTRRACSSCNKTHDINSDSYCGSCGGKIEVVEKYAKRDINHFQVFIEGHPSLAPFEDYGFTPAYRASDSFHKINFNTTSKDDIDDIPWVIETLDKLPMLENIKVKIDKFMAEFKKIYGEDSITLKYGIYSYYH